MTRTTQESSSLLKQAIKVNNRPFPWIKAFLAGLAAGLPVVIGLLLHNLQYGLIAGMGGFSFLYVFNIPYALRAKKIFFVVIGISLSAFFGTLLSPYPIIISIVMGIIGMVAVFIFGALKITGPSSIFFILVFALTSGMPSNPDLAFTRASLVFLGGTLSWILAMIGWFFHPHYPEINVLKRVYSGLAFLFDSVGTSNYDQSKQKVISLLKEAEETLTAGYIPWRKSETFKRLYVLKDHANKLFLYVEENFTNHEKLPDEVGNTLRIIIRWFDNIGDLTYETANKILQPQDIDGQTSFLLKEIYNAEAIMNEPIAKINQVIQISKPPLKEVLWGAFDKNSIVLISSIRFGLITMFAAIIAHELDFIQSYWVPLSCVAVMSGTTMVSTFHRTLQRGFGTIFGILIASVILAFHPSGFVIAFCIIVLTFITELFIVKNYGLAALFFTPNALLMAESTSFGEYSFTHFASARFIDVLIGSAIGLLGVWLFARKSASSRIPHLVAKSLRSQAQLLFSLFSDQGEGFRANDSREIRKMRINIDNLTALYNTAIGEIPQHQKDIDYYWSIIFSIEHFGYLLENYAKMGKRPHLSYDSLAQILLIFEMMANASNRQITPKFMEAPKINSFMKLTAEINQLQHAFTK